MLSAVNADLVIRNIGELLTCAGPAPRIGAAMREAGLVRDASVAALDGHIVFAGPAARCERLVRPVPDAVELDAADGAVVPGLVDAHTHVVFAGDRRAELQRRLAGASYAEIAAEGGGILATVHATRGASEEALTAAAMPRLAAMLRCGTTTAEVKSGYGLTTESELCQLRALRRLAGMQPVELAATFLGAHEVPPEHRSRPEDYVELVTGEMIPAVARERLAEWCDVFCEKGVFTPEQSIRILEAGRRAGLEPRIHANELAASGGVRAAVAVRARSADHLVCVDQADAASLAAGGVTATLLPAAAFYLKLGRFAPARLLIEAGVPVALGTDINPGGGLTPSMPFVMTLACFAMGLTFEEALTAATINAAWSLNRHERIGSLEVGKQCDLVLVGGPAVELLRADGSTVRAVVKRGRLVAGH